MATLREELEKKGFKSTQIRKDKDQIPEIDPRDKEVVDSFHETVGGWKSALYHPPKKDFPYRKKCGKVKILEVGKMKIDKDTQTYKTMEILYSLYTPSNIDEITGILRKENPDAKRSSINAFLGKFTSAGSATRATIGGEVKYSRIEGMDKDVAFVKYQNFLKTKSKDKRAKKTKTITEEVASSVKDIVDRFPHPEAGSGKMFEVITEKVAEKVAQKIILEVIGKIEFIFKFGGLI